ncbi:7977_t:CDS:2, partial [Funneliformis geosporum]
GYEFNRIQWNDLAVASSMKVIDKQNEERRAERYFQDKINTAFTTLENKIRNRSQAIPGTKKEIISTTESSEDVLDLYKRTDNTLKEIKASGRPLISK